MEPKNIKTYPAPDFKAQFIENSEPARSEMGKGFGVFFILKVEDMLSMMKLPVPAVKVTTHSFIFLTEGEANINIGTERYCIHKNEGIFVPEGQVFSFDRHDVNKGYFCNFHSDFVISNFTKSDITKDFEFLTRWGNPFVGLEEIHPYCRQLLERMHLEYRQHSLARKSILQSYLLALLCEVNEAYRKGRSGSSRKRTELTQRFKALLDQHIHSIHSVQEYASS